MPLKRISYDSTNFPPKKRALLEHKAEVLLDVSNFDHQNDDNNFDVKLPTNSQENLVTGVCPIAGKWQPVPFSHYSPYSMQFSVSKLSDNSDTYVQDGFEEKLSVFDNVFDHRTPERNPIKRINSQIAKPLFQARDASVGKTYKENEQDEKENLTKFDENGRNHHQQRQPYKAGKSPPFCKSSQSNYQRKCPSLQKGTRVGNQNNCYLNGRSPITNGNVTPGPMVSLIERFNAEAESRNKGSQSIDENTQNMTTSLAPGSYNKSSAKEIEMLANKPIVRSHATEHRSHDYTEHLKSTLTGESVDVYYDEKNDLYTCTVCDKQIKQKGHFLVHLKSHENQNCKCRICGEEMQSLEKLKEHMRCSHKGDKPFICDHCPREFSQYNNLRRHLRVHRAKIYKCALCDREFNEEFYLTMHMGTHTGKRVYSCGVCNATFSSSHDLKMHVKTHSPSQLHTCDVCGKSFSKACVLRQHKKGHTGDRPHKCEKCAKTFIHRHHLTMHMRSHSDDKQYTCEICKKEFYQSSHLYKHLRCHSDEKELLAVNAMKEKLYKKEPSVNQSEIHTGQSRSEEIFHRKKTVFNEDRRNHIHLEKELNVVKSQTSSGISDSTSDYQLSLSNSGVAGNQGLSSVAMAGTRTIRNNRHLSETQNLHNLPHVPTNLLPSVPGPGQQRLAQNIDPVYLAYASQYRAYYNSLYMMNLMSHDALLYPGNLKQNGLSNVTPKMTHDALQHLCNPAKQNGERHVTPQKTHDALLLPGTSSKQNTQNHVTPNENVGNSQNVSEFPTSQSVQRFDKLKSNGNVVLEELFTTKEDKARTEVAEELVKMSNGEKKDSEHQNPERKRTHQNLLVQTDKTQTQTKCIGDILNKTEILHQKQFSHQGESKPALSPSVECKKSVNAYEIHRHLQPYYTQPVKSEMTIVNSADNGNSSPIDFTIKKTSHAGATIHNGALNLSLNRNKEIKSGFKSGPKGTVSDKCNGLSNHVVMTTKLWNPAHSLPNFINPASTISTFQPSHKYLNASPSSFYQLPSISSLHRNNLHSNRLNNNNGQRHLDSRTFYSQSPIPRNMKDSPKKRHASSHDIVNPGVGLDLRDNLKVGRHRHWSEMQQCISAIAPDSSNVTDQPKFFNDKVIEHTRVQIASHVTENQDLAKVNRGIEVHTVDKITAQTENYGHGAGKQDLAKVNRGIEVHTVDKITAQTENYGHGLGKQDLAKVNRGIEVHTVDKITAQNENYGHGLGKQDLAKVNKEIEVDIVDKIIPEREDYSDSLNVVNAKRETELGEVVAMTYTDERECVEKVFPEIEIEKNNTENADARVDIDNRIEVENRSLYKESEKLCQSNKFVSAYDTHRHLQTFCNEQTQLDEQKNDQYGKEHFRNYFEPSMFKHNQSRDASESNDIGYLEDIEKNQLSEHTDYVVNTSDLDNEATDIDRNVNNAVRKKHKYFDDSFEDRHLEIDLGKTDHPKISENDSNTLEISEDLTKNFEAYEIFPKNLDLFDNDPKNTFECENDPKNLMLCENNQKDLVIYVNDPKKLDLYENDPKNLGVCENDPKNLDVCENDPKNFVMCEKGPKNTDRHEHVLNEKEQDENDPRIIPSSENDENLPNMVECIFCGEYFENKSKLKEHVIIHAVDKPYICNICQKSFSQRHNLKRHKMSHNSKSFECAICKRGFKESFYLQMHMKVHFEENNYQCEICGSQVEKSDVLNHTRRHLGNIVDNPTYKQIGHRVKEILREQNGNMKL